MNYYVKKLGRSGAPGRVRTRAEMVEDGLLDCDDYTPWTVAQAASVLENVPSWGKLSHDLREAAKAILERHSLRQKLKEENK